jgi:class 3 adenylate cyclase/tetratricopeptide (TPR) repeat protein
MIRCSGCGEENPPKFKLCGYCGTPLAAAATLPVRELRKTVTIVFSDLKGSTAIGERLDAEALHEVKARYFDAMAAEIARHGGKVEKYIGYAIMAVFGLPRTHEDDALRAVRAAFGMQQTLARVNVDLQARYGVALAQRIGVNTGEVVANDDPSADQKLATGDAVNVAARLEQAAPEKQVYIGEVTYRLVRDAVEVEAVEPLELKGKSQRVAAYRVVNVPGLDGNLRRVDTPIVGRDAELQQITAVYHEVVTQSAVRMVTVIGDAGVGKSRLVHEVVSRITAGATVLRGRCLPYGDGITFWPLRVMLTAADIRDDDKPEEAHAKLLSYLGDRDVVDRVAAATGLSAGNFPLHEIYWGARKALEILAERGPVVALVDDIHWAETAFLELLEHVLSTSSGAPILLVATSRHDLLEERPQWGEQTGASRIVLRPLNDAAAAQVVANLLGTTGLPPDVLARIVDTAEGNPLYVEQLLSMLIDRGALLEVDGRWVRGPSGVDIDVPPTINALLEARLGQLGRAERATVEPAAVIGLEFPQSALSELAPAMLRPTLDEHLATLTRKQFVHLSVAVLDATARYRFHHQLVRDTVYNGLLKRARAQLHIDFVRWADRVNADRDRALEFEEILGYHLEQAHRYLGELGPLDEQARAVGIDGAQRLSHAGRRAFARADFHAAVNLFRRAAQLWPAMHADRLALMPELGEALMELGDFAGARATIDELEQTALSLDNRRLLASARLRRMFIRMYGGEPGDWGAEALRVANESVTVFADTDAHTELATAWRLTAFVHGVAGRYLQANAATDHYMRHARLGGNQRLLARSGMGLANGLLPGPTPVLEGIERCERILVDVAADRLVCGVVMCIVAQLRAMNGEFDLAWRLCREGRATLHSLGDGVAAAQTSVDLARVALLSGDLADAEHAVRADHAFLSGAGEAYILSTVAGVLARVVRAQGRDDEALQLTRNAEAAAAADDVDAQVQWRAVRAPILARQGDLLAAESLAREAVQLASDTDAPLLLAEAQADLAEVLAIAARFGDAAAAYALAADIWERKGDRVSTGAARQLAAALVQPH